MVRQHDAARTQTNGRSAASEVTNHDGRRRARNAGHVVMLGYPVSRVAEGLCLPRQIQTLAQRFARRLTYDDRHEIENGDGNHGGVNRKS